jgi:hypothetical protein
MKKCIITLGAVACLLLVGCETRSISNSGYNAGYAYGYRPGPVGGYAGELSEFDVLGVDAAGTVTDAEIKGALDAKAVVRLARNSHVLLIQSGADFPDNAMQEALGARYTVGPFSGRPRTLKDATASYSKSLRLAAARGGYDKILCYWGVLESQRTGEVTKTVSWVPIVGFFVPDETQSMRIRLKAVLIDTATGNWVMLQPEPVTDKQISSVVSRVSADQGLVEKLKEQGYHSLTTLLTTGYSE